MSHSPMLGSPITHTHLRTSQSVSPFSGMCSVCTAECTGTCEVGLSAIRGAEAINPFGSDVNQFASEKDFPLDFSHFNINGRVFGAQGCPPDTGLASFPRADLHATFGLQRKVALEAPFILPAMAKLNWRDYFAGAALAGVLVVIGEDVAAKDPGLVMERGQVTAAPLIEAMLEAFRSQYRGFGDIILQANVDDEAKGLLDHAITRLGVKSVELKFGQAAKGIQGVGPVPRIEDALRFQAMGYLVHPDPSDPQVAADHARGRGPVFQKIGKLPMWDEGVLIDRVHRLRELGAERVCFKTGPFAPADLARLLAIASKAGVDLITFDGAGGGSGHSPARMMNEWGMPTVYLESVIHQLCRKYRELALPLPQIAMAGGFVLEDQVFKGLALGAPFVNLIGIGRGAMAAAMVGKRIGEALAAGALPREYARFGGTLDEVFLDTRILKQLLGQDPLAVAPGAVGVFSYLNRVATGLRQMMALNRKFALEHIDRSDLFPLTRLAAEVSGLPSCNDLMAREIEALSR